MFLLLKCISNPRILDWIIFCLLQIVFIIIASNIWYFLQLILYNIFVFYKYTKYVCVKFSFNWLAIWIFKELLLEKWYVSWRDNVVIVWPMYTAYVYLLVIVLAKSSFSRHEKSIYYIGLIKTESKI